MESQEEYSRVDALLMQSAWPLSKPSGTMKHICLHLTHFILIFDIHFNKKLLALKLSEGVLFFIPEEHLRGILVFSFLIFKEKISYKSLNFFFLHVWIFYVNLALPATHKACSNSF